MGFLDVHYRVGASAAGANGQLSRLDRIARQRLGAALDAALEQVFGGDPTVYILRRLEVDLTLLAGAGVSDSQIARRWGRQLARAIARTINRDPDDGANLIRFAGQAEYVARFVCDLLENRAWDHWYYGAFAELRTRTLSEALHQVLLDHREILPSILRYLHQQRMIEPLLDACGGAVLGSLWDGGSITGRLHAEHALRPLFDRALWLAERMSLLARPDAASASLLQAYLATGAALVNWQDKTSLSAAVIDILNFLLGQGHIKRPRADDPTFNGLLEEILADYDWLDLDMLRAQFEIWAGGAALPLGDLPVRPLSHGPTPVQKELLAALLDAMNQTAFTAPLNSDANAVRWYAALAARTQRLAASAQTAALIRRFLQICYLLSFAGDPDEMLRLLGRGDLKAALQQLPRAGPLLTGEHTAASNGRGSGHSAYRLLSATEYQAASADLAFLDGLGEPGLALLKAVVRRTAASLPGERNGRMSTVPDIASAQPDDYSLRALAGTASPNAGAALLLRALLDIRLSALLQHAAYPPLSPKEQIPSLLAALAMRWCGEAAIDHGHLETGICLLAGLEEPLTLAALRDVWASTDVTDDARFQEALCRRLAGQQFFKDSALHIYAVRLPGGERAVIGGAGMLWPFGRLHTTEDDIGSEIASWAAAYAEVRKPPLILVCDESLLELASRSRIADAQIIGVTDDYQSGDSSGLAAAHQAGLGALLAALAALDGGRLDLPGADLTLALTAVVLLRVWARWLRGFDRSSVPYLLEQFIHRSGRFYDTAGALIVELEPRSLDMVVEMAGYMRPLENVSWLANRSVQFRLRGSG